MGGFSPIRHFSLSSERSLARVEAQTGETLMSPKPLKFHIKSRDNEAIFLSQYKWLLDWARQLTQGLPGEGEDLVQDLYIRFVQMRSGSRFADEDHIRGYLYKSLKNLYISRKLRYGRDAVSGLLVVDFDSVEFAMQGIDRSELLHVRGDLAAVCEYACIRRKTNRAAAALILRFFLGYLPTEVLYLLRTNRSTLDALLQTARLEAKAYLNRPGVLRFLHRGERSAPSFPRFLPEEPEALFTELHRRIFSQTEGACLSSEILKDRYALHPDAPAFSIQEIAHLTSCRECLNQASRLLGLPDLVLRFFTEGKSPEDGPPPSAPTAQDGLRKLRRKLRETYEHRPKKLQIAVDGEIRGVQTITAAYSNVQLKLGALSKPGFVEVFSEQGIGLLYFDPQQETVPAILWSFKPSLTTAGLHAIPERTMIPLLRLSPLPMRA
jgi:DNA-directed RNA polymerase specialized sigma24 family protein